MLGAANRLGTGWRCEPRCWPAARTACDAWEQTGAGFLGPARWLRVQQRRKETAGRLGCFSFPVFLEPFPLKARAPQPRGAKTHFPPPQSRTARRQTGWRGAATPGCSPPQTRAAGRSAGSPAGMGNKAFVHSGQEPAAMLRELWGTLVARNVKLRVSPAVCSPRLTPAFAPHRTCHHTPCTKWVRFSGSSVPVSTITRSPVG